jgi:hypothetical protein
LTGDVSAISQDDLFQQGYPSRPDQTAHPQAYSEWLQSVSRPANVVRLVPVADLDTSFGYYGQYNCGSFGWTGMVQAAASFHTYCSANSASSNSQFYREYVMNTFIPYYLEFGCDAPCQTGIWAGLGGSTTNGITTPSLPQHGFAVLENAVDFMWEWAVPGASANTSGLTSNFSEGDNVTVQGTGVSSNSCSASPATQAYWFCYQWFDTTSNWTAWITLQNPNQSIWYPNTFEFIAEPRAPGYNNAPYGWFYGGEPIDYVTMSGWGVDFNGNAHDDDGAGGTDTYLYVQETGYNTGFWGPTDSFSSPADPWVLEFQNSE